LAERNSRESKKKTSIKNLRDKSDRLEGVREQKVLGGKREDNGVAASLEANP